MALELLLPQHLALLQGRPEDRVDGLLYMEIQLRILEGVMWKSNKGRTYYDLYMFFFLGSSRWSGHLLQGVSRNDHWSS